MLAFTSILALLIHSLANVTGKVIGIVTERDYLTKIAFLGKSSSDTSVAEIAIHDVSELVTVTRANPIDRCMEKMLARDVRHLLIRDSKPYDSEVRVGVAMCVFGRMGVCVLVHACPRATHRHDAPARRHPRPPHTDRWLD